MFFYVFCVGLYVAAGVYVVAASAKKVMEGCLF